MSDAATKTLAVTGDIRLFDVQFLIESRMEKTGDETRVIFSVRVGNRTLGDVLRYLVDLASPGTVVELGKPWSVIDSISLKSLAFEIDFSSTKPRYGFSYSDIDLDLGFVRIDKIELWYRPAGAAQASKSVDVNIFGMFFGLDFTRTPLTWDALKERPPATPGDGEKVFQLDYLGLGQRVTLRDIRQLDTIAKVMAPLMASYKDIPPNAADPLSHLLTLTYDESAQWLVGAKFAVLETFDLSAVWNLPALAGARIGLRGERVKSLAGLQFEILYRRIADDLGLYHIELVLPDVLRKFQAGAAAVTLPIIVIDIYTDGGFLIDLGFPRGLDFSRSFSIDVVIMGVPVTGALGVYFGVLNAKAVPALPTITGGSFKPVIVLGVGARIGVGKNFELGILSAGIFIGIEGLMEGIVGFYTPVVPTDPKATFFRFTGTLQLIGHVWGEVDFGIVKGKVDIYAYVSAGAAIESYRATLVVFEAGVQLKITVKVGYGIFSFKIKLEFSATIRHELTLGRDEATPWRLAAAAAPSLRGRFANVGYRVLPTGELVADAVFSRMRADAASLRRRTARAAPDASRVDLELYFHPVATIGVQGDRPAGAARDRVPSPADRPGEVLFVASLMARISRNAGEALAPAEGFVAAALEWGLDEVRSRETECGGAVDPELVTLSELHFLADDLVAPDPAIPIDLAAMKAFLQEYVTVSLRAAGSNLETTHLTPFPMVPFLSLSTSDGAHAANFETQPRCSLAYQRFVTEYFDELSEHADAGRAARAQRAADAQELSMAGIIFVDTFRIVLRSAVRDAIEQLRLFPFPAAGLHLAAVVEAAGLPRDAGLRHLAAANIENEHLFAAGTTLHVVASGTPLGPDCDSLTDVANATELPILAAARNVRQQPILRVGSGLRVSGGTYTLRPPDSPESLAKRFETTWEAIQEANPEFDWSVPPVPPGGHYPDLEVPAGETIALPTVLHTVAEGETLQSIADYFGAPLYALVALEKDAPSILLERGSIAWRAAPLYVLENETLAELAARAGLSGTDPLAALYPTIKDEGGLLRPGAGIVVPAGRYVFRRGDTLFGVARRFQTTPDAIVAVNNATPEDAWKFIPRPDTDEAVPSGVEINLPEIADYRVSDGETLASIARKFSLANPYELASRNHDARGLLYPLAGVVLPPVPWPVPPEGVKAIDLARRYALDPVELVLANQGVERGQGSAVALDRVLVPQCERVREAALIARLAAENNGPESSVLAATATGLARFLMAGLRLPAPGALTAIDPLSVPLFPMYTLTGQQWPAPPDPTKEYYAELKWNDSAEAVEFRRLVSRAPEAQAAAGDAEPVQASLTDRDIELVRGFRALLNDAKPLLPPPLARTIYPTFEIGAMECALGEPIHWSTPTNPTFVSTPPQRSGEIDVRLLPIPRSLREILPTSTGNPRQLDVLQSVPDPITGHAAWRIVADVGWAARIEVQIAPVRTTGDDAALVAGVYEVLSGSAQAQADLVALLGYLKGAGATDDVALHVLYATNPLGHLAGTLRSDDIPPADRARVALLKSNLSTFSRPPAGAGIAAEGGTDILAAATLDAPRDFLELLWEVTVTNAGGFYLDYRVPPDRPGLPSEIFESGAAATLSFLAIVRPAGSAASIGPRRFHNSLVFAENLAGAAPTVIVTARPHVVAAVEPPPSTQSLDDIAALYPGLTAPRLAEINATTPGVLKTGIALAFPTPATTYTVQPGDTLLSVALALETSVADLATAYRADRAILSAGAALQVYPEWVVQRNRVDQALGGFRIVRGAPTPIDDRTLTIRQPTADDLEVDTVVQRLFNLLGYSLLDSEIFEASTQGLPVVPARPRLDRSMTFAAAGDAESDPWIYERLLPVAKWAKTEPWPDVDRVDPYANLTKSANIGVRFQDVFGNELPGAAVAPITWEQFYRDPLLPIHTWPSITIAYEVKKVQSEDAPVVVTRIKFAPAGYVTTIGMPLATAIRRATADRDVFARAFFQTVDERVAITQTTTIRPGYREVVSSTAVATFAAECFGYLGAVASLRPRLHTAGELDTLERIAGLFEVGVGELAAVLSGQEGVLREGSEVIVPFLWLVMPSTSARQIVEEANASLPLQLTAYELGTLNLDAPLTAELVLNVGGVEITTDDESTLRRLQTDKANGGDIAEANRAVKSLFRENEVLWLGEWRRPVQPGDTFASIAQVAQLPVERLAEINRKQPILRADAPIEVPRHVELPAASAYVKTVEAGESIEKLAMRLGCANRDLLTANSDAVDLLAVTAPPQVMWYAPPDSMTLAVSEDVAEHDTLSTVTRRFSERLGLPSLVPADVGTYPANLQNGDLLRAGARVLVPPRRIEINLRVPPESTKNVTIAPLEVTFEMERPEDAIAPRFRDVVDVRRAHTVVPPRLSSEYTQEERASMRPFARIFHEVFPNLWLATGPDTLPSDGVLAAAVREARPESNARLLVVQWFPRRLDFALDGPPFFFAPAPLSTELWNEANVPIYPYTPGQPLPVPPVEPALTDFTAVDLDRWAGTFLDRIDTLLRPGMSAALRRLSAASYQTIITAKQDIAEAIAARVEMVLERNDTSRFEPDVESAREQFLQQLLVLLGDTYRGGTVVQFNATVQAPAAWERATAPRLFGSVTQAAFPLKDHATLDALADAFHAPVLLVAETIEDVQNLLDVGKTVPLGDRPTIRQQDTIRSIRDQLGVDLPTLVEAVRGLHGFLSPRAGVELVARAFTADEDDTFASAVEQLALSLTSRGLVEIAVRRFVALNGTEPRVFREGETLVYEHDGKSRTHVTTADDSVASAAAALEIAPDQFVHYFYVTAPLLRAAATFRFLALYPPSTISNSKLALYVPKSGEPASKLNVLYVTSAPDESSSAKLRLAFRTQDLEYNIHDVPFSVRGPRPSYQASDWLTFIDWERECDLGLVEIPIPNRQFPIPPAVLTHATIPHVVPPWSAAPPLDALPLYDYVMSFAFHAAAQDHLFYEPDYNVAVPPAGATPADAAPPTLATHLAQWQSIDAALWADLTPLGDIAALPDERVAIVKNAIEVFAGLARQIAAAWKTWPSQPGPEADVRYRIRHHRHADGRAAVTVRRVGSPNGGRPMPSVRLPGRTAIGTRVSSGVHQMQFAPSKPVPHTRGADRYEVRDPDLTVLREQNVWGRISVSRNELLVAERRTNPRFVLHVRKVGAAQPAIPMLAFTQKLDVARELGPLAGRLARLLGALLFPTGTSAGSNQLVSLTASFARRLVEGDSAAGIAGPSPQPDDLRTLFAPVVTSRAFRIDAASGGSGVTPAAVAAELAAVLDEWLVERRLSATQYWSLALRLFGQAAGDEARPPLLEVLDLRARMSDQ